VAVGDDESHQTPQERRTTNRFVGEKRIFTPPSTPPTTDGNCHGDPAVMRFALSYGSLPPGAAPLCTHPDCLSTHPPCSPACVQRTLHSRSQVINFLPPKARVDESEDPNSGSTCVTGAQPIYTLEQGDRSREIRQTLANPVAVLSRWCLRSAREEAYGTLH
jgi:hypothetical protein